MSAYYLQNSSNSNWDIINSKIFKLFVQAILRPQFFLYWKNNE